MPDIRFILPDGTEQGLEAPSGLSLMQVATGFGIDGIVAECGGAARCATCHVIVDPAWVAQLPPPGPDEGAMLELTAAPREPGSRLACQVLVTDAMQGLIVRVAERQH